MSVRWLPLSRRGMLRDVLALVAAFGLGVALLVALPVSRAAAAPCDPPVVNPVACENTKPGNPPSEWDINGSGSSSIQGFATDISVDKGQTIGFKVKTSSTNYRLDIYRMGYYGGNGARKVTTVTPSLYTNQPNCLTQSTTGLVDCGNWRQTASWTVPTDAVSGIYFAKLVAGAASSHIVFVVRDDASRSHLLLQTSDTTWQAYNDYGGNSLYEGQPAGRAYKVSYNRPFDTAAETPEDFVWNAEYPMVRFLEANGYDVSYSTGVDTDRNGALIKNHKVFLSVGHDEYWSGGQRANVEAARSTGVHLAFFSGNEVFWKTRWENSIATGAASYRTLVTYKETHANAVIDPQDPPTWTGSWMDPRFSPPADGGRPQNALTGQLFTVNCCTYDMKVGSADGKLRFWRNTRVANLANGATTTLGADLLGYEWDEDKDNGFRPPGLVRMSSTTISGADVLQDYGSTYSSGTATHRLTLYRDPTGGGLVFGAGTVQWAWGLDAEHDRSVGAPADAAVQQATVNLLADMGAQPAALQSGLVAATASTDTTPPTSTISSPADGATVPVNQPLTVTGTATDAGGGRVGAVEVSADGGTTWHPATGRESWSYTFTPTTNGTLTIKTRAADDSARLETPSAGRTVTVGSGPPPPVTCPCTIWPSTATPAVAAESDTSAIEVGVKFRAAQDGFVTGIRFYKGSGNTGTHVGSLWTRTGTKLTSVTFGGETATGWQQANFTTPVAVTANTTYVASYYAPVGRYAVNDGYFTTATTRGPLTALEDSTDGGNGVYGYGTSGFPTSTYASSNYWVDVVFNTSTTDTTKPTLTAKQPAAGATGVPVTSTVTATFSEPVQAASIAVELRDASNALVTGTTTYDSSAQKATFTPATALSSGVTYTAKVSGATDAAGNTMDPVTWTFTTAAAPPPDTTKPTLTDKQPAAGATNVALTSAVTATFSEPVQEPTVSVTLSSAAGSVAGTQTYDSANRTVTFTPNSALAVSTTYTAGVSGATDTAGNVMDGVTWTFTTAASASGCPCTIWPDTTTPAVTADPDTSSVELGVKFRANQSGFITGIRFYKGSGNTGTHVGSLWTRTGTKLASVTSGTETATGWQQANFTTPVAVTANTTYVASYYAPNGRYAVNEDYFTTATTRGPLTALQNGTDGGNGVYKYGASGLPTSTYLSSNYWIDVVFNTTAS